MPVGQGARNNILLGGLGRPNLFDTNVKATSIDEDIFSDQTEVTAAEDADLVLVLDTSETPDKIKFITKSNFIGEGLVAITGNVNNRIITATGSALVGESNLLYDGTILTNDGGEVNVDIASGDPHLSFQIGGTDKFTIGVDDDDSDTLKIDTGGTVGGGTILSLTSGGVLDVDGGVTIDNITIDGTEIDLSSGDLTLDVAGDIVLDANGGNVTFKDDGTSILDIANSSTDVEITVSTADKNLKFKGTDGSSAITALDIDMAAAGAATFNSDVVVGGLLKMSSNTASKILVADGSSFEEVAVGDLSEISSIANDDVFIAIDTTDGVLKKVSRSQVVSGLAASGAITDLVDDSTPQLGGNLDVNSNDIVSTSNGNIKLLPNGSGKVIADGDGSSGGISLSDGVIDIRTGTGSVAKVLFYCESSNAHAQTLQAQPHSAGVTNTLTLPAGSSSTLVSLVSTDTLTNKTLTTPKIAEIDSLSSGNIVLDAEANIEINADGGTITFKDDSASLGTITSSGYSGTAAVATTVTITDNENTDEDNAVVFTAGGDVDGGNLGLESDGDLTYNPNSGTLTATNLAGTLTTAAQGNVTSLGTLSALTIDDVAVDGKVITMTGSSSDTAVLTAGTNGTLSIVTTDAAAAAANITITADGTFEADGTTITLDSGGDIVLDAAGNDINFKAGGTSVLDITNNSTDVELTVSTADKNFLIKGTDGSSAITALDIDMALAGKATFNGDVVVGGDLTITGDDLFMNTNTAGHILVGDDTNYNPVAVSGDVTLASNGAVTIADNAVESGMLNNNIISGLTEISSGLADADELLYSDAGTIKRVGLDTLSSHIASSVSATAADDIGTGDAAVNLTTSSGNITIDAAANNTDIIFKGTDASSDITMLTLDGSEAGNATFNAAVTVGTDLTVTGGDIIYGNGQNATLDVADVSGTNTAGKSLTILGGAGTGSGAGGDIIFQVANAGGSGSSVNSHATALTISDDKIATFADDIIIKDGGTFGVASATDALTISSGGIVTFVDDILIKDGGTIGNASVADVMTLASTGIVTFKDDIIIKDGGTIGSASDTDAITIASDGVVTMDQIPVFSAGINVSGGTIAGTLATAAQANITSLGILTALTVDDVAVNGKVVTMTGSTDDTAVFTVGTHGTLSIVTTDTAAAAANIQITADGTAELAGTTVTLDSGGDIVLDAAGDDIEFNAGGTAILKVTNSSTDVDFVAQTQDKDIRFKGDDGGAGITALTLDMSDAGTAIFNHDIVIADGGQIGSASDTNAVTISSGGVVAITATTANSDASDGALTVAGGASVAADFTVGDDLRLLSDSAVLSFGADGESTITHADDAGLTFNSTTTFDEVVVAADKDITMGASSRLVFGTDVPNTDHEATGVIVKITSSGALARGVPVYIDGSGTVAAADANAVGTMPAIGINTTDLSGGAGEAEILISGIFRDDDYNFGPGDDVFVGTDPTATAGTNYLGITTTAPSGSGDTVQKIGVALTADTVFFNFNTAEVLLA